MFTILSTIFVPRIPGLSFSPSLIEQDLLLKIGLFGLPQLLLLSLASREDNNPMHLEAEAGLSGNEEFNFGGASTKEPCDFAELSIYVLKEKRDS